MPPLAPSYIFQTGTVKDEGLSGFEDPRDKWEESSRISEWEGDPKKPD